jgi:hypothetical protein
MPMTFAARTFARRTAFFRLDNAAAGDRGRGMTMGASAGKRRCKSAKASGLPTKTGRPDLSYKMHSDPPFKSDPSQAQGKKGGAPKKTDSSPADGRPGMTMGGEVGKARRVAANGISHVGAQVRHFTMLTGFRLMTTSLF